MDVNVDQQKKQIRKQIKDLKAKISLSEKKIRSINILDQVENLPEFKNANTIMLYWSMEDEVHTHDFVNKHSLNKKILLPSVSGDNLIIKEFKGMSNLIKGQKYAIAEPQGKEFDMNEKIDFIIVPGVAFDLKNNRMGRGKAYYDKTLAKIDAFKLGVCFNFQLLDSVPIDIYDIPMDLIISE